LNLNAFRPMHIAGLCLLIPILTAAVQPAPATTAEAWNRLAENQFEEALAALPSATDTGSLLCRGFVHYARGDDPEAAESWLAALGDCSALSTEQLQGLLFFLNQVSQRVPIDERLLTRYGEVLAADSELSPGKRLVLLEYIEEIAKRTGRWAEAEQAAEARGLFKDWQWVAGPFARFGTEDYDEPFGPEKNLAANKWTRAGWSVSKVFLPGPASFGSLNFPDFLTPAAGVAYAFAQFEVESATDAILRLESEDSVRLWINGQQTLEKNTVELQLNRRVETRCPLRSGRNWILVKSQKSGPGWSLRLQILDVDGKPLSIQIPAKPARPSPPRVDPVVPQSLVGAPPEQFFFLEPGRWEASSQVPSGLLGWAASVNAGQWEEAEQTAAELIEQASSFALLHRLAGETLLLESMRRPGSKNRMDKQAQEFFESALEAYPGDGLAASLAAFYHISHRTWDQAEAVLEACLSYRQKEGLPIPIRLWIERGRIHEQKGFWFEAREDFTLALDRFPGNLRAAQHLTRLLNQSQNPALGFDAIKKALEMRGDAGLLALFLEQGRRTGREDETLAALERSLAGRPTSRSLLLERARYEVRKGDLEAARTWFERIMKQCPDDATPYVELAKGLLAGLSATTADQETRAIRTKAAALLEKALERSPDAYTVRDLLRQNRLELSDQAAEEIEQDWYSPYDIRVEEIDEAALKDLPQKRAGAVYLIDSSVMEILPDGSARTQTHQAILLKNKEGRARFAEIKIPSRPDVRLLWARTLSPDRSRSDEPTSIQDLGGQTAISMINLQDGSIIDYAYEESPRSGSLPGRKFQNQTFFFGGPDDPMLISRFTVITPKDAVLHVSTHPADFEAQVTADGDRTVYQWEKRNSEGIKPERFQPPLSEIVPTVRISTVPDYLIGHRAVRDTPRGRAERLEEIEKATREAIGDLEDRQAKIDAIYTYVQRNIEQSGYGGRTVYDTLYMASGSSLERAFLAQAMLKAAGIASHLAVSYNPRQHDGLPPIPTTHYLSGWMLFVPGEDPSGVQLPGHLRDRWLNFDSRYQPPNELQSQLSQQFACVLQPGGEIFTVPDPGQSPGGWMATEAEFETGPDGSAQVQGRLAFFGTLRPALRQQMTNPDFRRRVVDLTIGRDLRGIQIDRSTVYGQEQLEDHLAFDFEGTMPQLLRPAGERFHLSPVLVPSRLADLVPDATRAHPLEFQSWAKFSPYSIRVQLPEATDWTFLEIPEDTVLVSQFGLYSLVFHREGRAVRITRSLIVQPQRIEPEDYSRFAEFCRKVDAAEKRDLVIGSRGLLE